MKRSVLTQLDQTTTRCKENFYFFKNDLFIGQSLRLYGEYTQPEIDLLSQMTADKTVIFDIGANIGYHTVCLAQKAKEVHSFEANPDTFEVLELNCNECENVFLYNCALSNRDGKTLVDKIEFSAPGNYGEVHVGPNAHTQSHEVLCFQLDSLNLPAPNIIKIDVEGHELAVIEGAWQTIKKHRPILFYENMHNPDFLEIFGKLKNLDYDQYWFPVYNYHKHNFKQNETNVFFNSGVINVLAVPKFVTVNGLDRVKDGQTSQDYLVEKFGTGK